MDERTGTLVAKGRPGSTRRVVLYSQVYPQLMTPAVANIPATTIGALIGIREPDAGGESIVITEAVPLVRLPTQAPRLIQGKDEWVALQARLADAGGRLALVGWFYADPGLAFFAPRLDLTATHADLAPAGGLLLLVNPSSGMEEGACYLWEAGRFVSAGGFYEAVSEPGAAPLIPWRGQVTGADRWINAPPPPLDAAPGPRSAPTRVAPARSAGRKRPVRSGPGRGMLGRAGLVLAGVVILIGGWIGITYGPLARLLAPTVAPVTPAGSPGPGTPSAPPGTPVAGMLLSPGPSPTPAPSSPGPAATPALPLLTATLTLAPPTAGVNATPRATPLPALLTTPAPATLAVGAAVQVVLDGDAHLNVRAAPGTGGTIIGSLTPGTRARIVDGPRDADGAIWWQIRDWDSVGTLGWVMGKYLQAAP